MVAIGITGRRYSGKTLAAEWLQKTYGFRLLDFTQDVLAPRLKRQGKRVTRKNLIELACRLRERYGRDILARMLVRKARGDRIVISGIRFPEEVQVFRKRWQDFLLIAILAPAKLRWRRAGEIRKGEGSLSFRQFLKIESAETERHIPQLIRMADFRIRNDGSKEELYRKLDKIVKPYLK
ncbi:MAG: hypothetical protein DRP12_00660 [Candidatus Aenigmatarchaeota archaeon]|nr:MAG: hypothetical protein DRP12_00660 [Candidatus Aenigmarchaeota archaeon]